MPDCPTPAQSLRAKASEALAAAANVNDVPSRITLIKVAEAYERLALLIDKQQAVLKLAE